MQKENIPIIKKLLTTFNSNFEFPSEAKIKYESTMIETYKNRTKDDRKLLINPSLFPFKPIGALLSKSKDNNYYLGTGVLIAPNYVLTAAHNPYEEGFRASEFYFAPAVNSKTDTKPFSFKYSRGTEFFIFEKYEKFETGPDLAVLKLEQPLGDEFGFFELKALESKGKDSKSKMLNFFGYPGDKYKEANYTYQMWGQAIKDYEIEYFNEDERDKNEKNLVFKCDSYSGMSGAPIFEVLEGQSDKAAVYGVFWGHDYVDYKRKKGYAFMLNDALIKRIKEYIEKN